MGKCQCRQIFVFFCKFCQLCDHIHQFFLYQFQSFGHNNNIGVVTYITGSCTQMDDSLCLRALYTICIYMRHNIMTYLAFSLFCHIIVNIVFVRF